MKDGQNNWKQIEKDFIEWDNATHSNASQRQILDWFKKRVEKQGSISPADIENAEDMLICFLDEEGFDIPEDAIPKIVGAMQQYRKNGLREELIKLLGLNNPYPLKEVLIRLRMATNVLLHEKNYDRHGYEELEQCAQRAKEIILLIDEQFKIKTK